MRRFIANIIGELTLGAFMLVAMTAGITVEGSRTDSEDMVFSYARESDRVVFGGVGYVNTILQDMNHPDKSVLYVQDLATGTKNKVFEAGDRYVGNPQVAPSGAAIAVQVSPDTGFHETRLLVLTGDGKEITSFAQGREFAWSPDSRFLAYTTGEVKQIYTLQSTGTWLYDHRLRTTKKIYDKGHYVAWSQADHNLYIWDESDGRRHILRYDPMTQKVLETAYKGIYFSPTGRYYHGTRPSGVGTVEVFETRTNQPVLARRPRIAALMQRARIVGWATEGDVLILEIHRPELTSKEYPHGRFDTILYDVVNDIARVIPNDSVIGWHQGQPILLEGGKFSKRPLTSLPLLPDKQ
ncbi:MAG TPA: hypothetical protein VLA99_02415 [Nitrospiraceae bacterium]|nr:hypothetical protein [Nitrospiraceae bacterium]